MHWQHKFATIYHEDAERMIQSVFNVNRSELAEDGIKTWREWLDRIGPAWIGMAIDNDAGLYNLYLSKEPEGTHGADIVEQFVGGQLPRKPQVYQPVQRPTVEPTGFQENRLPWQSQPHEALDAVQARDLYERATQRGGNEEVAEARKSLYFAFNKDKLLAQKIGISQRELNDRIRSYSGLRVKDTHLEDSLNRDVPEEHQWTGITNSTFLGKQTVSNEELDQFVKDIDVEKGATYWHGTVGEQLRHGILTTFLAIDTRIDYGDLSFVINKIEKRGKRFGGEYSNTERKITISDVNPNTIAHEVGHYLDYKWARNLGIMTSPLSETMGVSGINEDQSSWHQRFRLFIHSLAERADIYSEYTQERREIFARFIDAFMQWSNRGRVHRESYRADKFEERDYHTFVSLLQEKSYLDSKYPVSENKMAQRLAQIQEPTYLPMKGKKHYYEIGHGAGDIAWAWHNGKILTGENHSEIAQNAPRESQKAVFNSIYNSWVGRFDARDGIISASIFKNEPKGPYIDIPSELTPVLAANFQRYVGKPALKIVNLLTQQEIDLNTGQEAPNVPDPEMVKELRASIEAVVMTKIASKDFLSEHARIKVSDIDRYISDDYSINVALQEAGDRYSVGLYITNHKVGVSGYQQYWHYDKDELSQARKTYDRVQEVAKDVTVEIGKQALPHVLLKPFIRNRLDGLDMEHKEKSGISTYNWYTTGVEKADDWRATLYGTRYPNLGHLETMNQNWNEDEKGKKVETEGNSSRDMTYRYNYDSDVKTAGKKKKEMPKVLDQPKIRSKRPPRQFTSPFDQTANDTKQYEIFDKGASMITYAFEQIDKVRAKQLLYRAISEVGTNWKNIATVLIKKYNVPNEWMSYLNQEFLNNMATMASSKRRHELPKG